MTKFLQRVEDLGLDGDVERGHRLVGNNQLGPQHQRRRDADSLPLPACERIGIAIQVLGLPIVQV